MRYLTVTAVVGFVTFFSIAPFNKVNAEREHVKMDSIPTLPVVTATIPDRIKQPEYRGNTIDFINAIAELESGDRYDIVGKTGHLGRYQFHPNTLRALGFNVTKEEFLSSPQLQDSAMRMYMRDNEAALKWLIEKYDGQVYKGVLITRSGIVAGAHFAGQYGLKSWFYPDRYLGGITEDRYGMTVAKYMTRFANYNLDE